MAIYKKSIFTVLLNDYSGKEKPGVLLVTTSKLKVWKFLTEYTTQWYNVGTGGDIGSYSTLTKEWDPSGFTLKTGWQTPLTYIINSWEV